MLGRLAAGAGHRRPCPAKIESREAQACPVPKRAQAAALSPSHPSAQRSLEWVLAYATLTRCRSLFTASMSFNPNAGSFNPNANTWQPSSNAPPFRPGQAGGYQPQNPYGAPQGQFYPQQGQYGQYGQPPAGYPYGGGYQGGNVPQGYGAHDPFAQQNNNQHGTYGGNHYQQQAPHAPRDNTQAYVPPARAQPAPAPSVPFTRAEVDSNAPAPVKAPTMSLKIGGGSAANSKPATVSLNIGGSKSNAASSSSKNAPPGSSKAATPNSSKPATPAPEKVAEKAKAATAAAATTPSKKDSLAADKPAAAASSKKDAPEDGASAAKEDAKTADALLHEVRAVADEETLADLYGNDEEAMKNIKPHINIVFIGHVDAGKSTMGGNILYLCGMVDKRTLEKYEKEAKEAGRESWYLSWALDSTSQEREKGKTVEVGRAYFETDARRYTILDAPGHKTFVPSMISGAAQADVAVLVISARKGEFETGFEKGGQTREHAMLVKTAGVQKLIVVVNKMDDPTVNWDKARFDEIQGKLTPFLKGTGYNVKTDVQFIPISGFTGANLKEDVDRKVAPWVEGVSLLNFLDNMALVDRKTNAPLLMPISEKYADMGTVVVGKVESGKLRKGQNLLLMPNKTPVTVTGINNEMEEEVPLALCGDNVRVRLRGVEDEDVSVGFVLSSVEQPVHTVTHFEAQLVIVDHKNIICAGYGAVMHVHTLSEEVALSKLLHYYDKKSGKKSRRPPQFAKKGQKIIALIETAAPVSVERFADHPQLGRFTLRDEGKTIAIGKITKVSSMHWDIDLIKHQEDLPDVAKLDIAAA
ncbi:BZ3500_MvSof-1268-A1-R1_Chr4-1g06751 [Microbotryum saponariae]|uniref:Eukaryotic peptide chain release factor GTP-binding subunit n=1 Tax=Microbotryum saponariae TaxID=289078 RepID=A0A2X0KWN6_9BASI|nr:BZ3500_MvSof-1268-A1-R1_Chr4-1g06751 [Microbotryum saponariae]SDA06416.1 BZ3501_MvSof-1269-A2-R1_Chr4-1g06461 [Microbotryum saponariae]